MKRFFNTTGLCNPQDHYMVNPFRGMYDDILRLIESKQYFLIHAPRQTGKTTFLHSLAHRLNAEGKYVAVVCSLESAGYASITVEKANKVFIRSVYQMAKDFLEASLWPPEPDTYQPEESLFKQYLSDWCRSLPKPLILLLDEVDALYDDVLISTLRQLRDGFQSRPAGFPQSIALVGLRDIREYRMRARSEIRPLALVLRSMSRPNRFFFRYSASKKCSACCNNIQMIQDRFFQKKYSKNCTNTPVANPG